jgi:hypothetical protein
MSIGTPPILGVFMIFPQPRHADAGFIRSSFQFISYPRIRPCGTDSVLSNPEKAQESDCGQARQGPVSCGMRLYSAGNVSCETMGGGHVVSIAHANTVWAQNTRSDCFCFSLYNAVSFQSYPPASVYQVIFCHEVFEHFV